MASDRLSRGRQKGNLESVATRPFARSVPQGLGYAGLIPQIIAVVVVAMGPLDYRFSAQASAIIYAGLIVSFLGGLWWGLAVSRADTTPDWVWFAGVAPSLIAMVASVPWAIGAIGPTVPLIVLGLALMSAPIVDQRLDAVELLPAGWLALRVRLSIGLGLLTALAALL